MFITIVKLLRMVMILGLLNGCSTGDEYRDIREFMMEVEKKPRGSITPLPEFKAYQPFTYGASNQRSPFELPIVLVPKSLGNKSNINIKPPRDHVKQYLEGFPLAALAMVGSLRKNKLVYALIEDTDGVVHRVQIGDYMGDQWGQIESIEEARIDITEIVADGSGGWLRRPRTIELRGLQ